MTDRSGPLSGLHVIDLTRFPPGGYCTVVLADLGADVCRIQGPKATVGLPVALARNKRSVCVDLRHPQGNDVLRRLVRWADVVVEAERPGAMDERGFGYAQASVEAPSVIWCSISGFGQDGPYAQSGGHDLSYMAHSGLLSAVASELPWHPQAVLALPVAALHGVVGILSALRDRDRTGRGCQLDISISEAATWMLSGADSELNGPRRGIPAGPDRHLYRCSDGAWVAVASAEPRTWRSLCEAIGVLDLVDSLHRWHDAPAVTKRLGDIFAARPAAEWVAELTALGVSIASVNRGPELRNDPHASARGTVQTLGDLVVPRNPIRSLDGDGDRWFQDPVEPASLGAHTNDVLIEAGYSAAEIGALSSSGAIGS